MRGLDVLCAPNDGECLCSGCHLNPAVTVAMFIVGAIKWLKALLYVVVQLSGAIAAAGIFRVSGPCREYD